VSDGITYKQINEVVTEVNPEILERPIKYVREALDDIHTEQPGLFELSMRVPKMRIPLECELDYFIAFCITYRLIPLSERTSILDNNILDILKGNLLEPRLQNVIDLNWFRRSIAFKEPQFIAWLDTASKQRGTYNQSVAFMLGGTVALSPFYIRKEIDDLQNGGGDFTMQWAQPQSS
jgi:hypothetical protein